MKIRKSLKPSASLLAVSNPQGSILVLALWTICFLSVLAVSLGFQVRQKLQLIKRLDERDTFQLIAEAGLKRAIMELKKEVPKGYDSLEDGWADTISVFKDVLVGEGSFSVYYSYSDEQSGALKTRYGLIDEERKININKMEPKVIDRLLRLLGIREMEAQELAASIKDWRDADSELSLPFGSAEDTDYHNRANSYEAKDADFESLDELYLVKGVTKDIFEKIKEYVTIYGDGKVNINTASKVVLISLGLSEDVADKIISFRTGDKTKAPEAFTAVSEIVPKLSQLFHLSESDIASLSAVVERYLTVSSNNFTGYLAARLPNRVNSLKIVSVIDKTGKILYWREP